MPPKKFPSSCFLEFFDLKKNIVGSRKIGPKKRSMLNKREFQPAIFRKYEPAPVLFVVFMVASPAHQETIAGSPKMKIL